MANLFSRFDGAETIGKHWQFCTNFEGKNIVWKPLISTDKKLYVKL